MEMINEIRREHRKLCELLDFTEEMVATSWLMFLSGASTGMALMTKSNMELSNQIVGAGIVESVTSGDMGVN